MLSDDIVSSTNEEIGAEEGTRVEHATEFQLQLNRIEAKLDLIIQNKHQEGIVESV